MITFDFENKSDENQILAGVRENFEMIENRTKKRVLEYDSNVLLSLVAHTEAEVEGEKFTIRISNNVLVPVSEKLNVN